MPLNSRMPHAKVIKDDDLSLAHLTWLVGSRSRNQQAALRLFEFLNVHEKVAKTDSFNTDAQRLVAVCFSLWRAAFLADRTGIKHAAFADARAFLGKMLIDNAINYAQDRSAREWTFRYYMDNAKEGLIAVGNRWPEVKKILSRKKSSIGRSTSPQRRWTRHQDALEAAINFLAIDLKAAK